jgi:hypothetical protein
MPEHATAIALQVELWNSEMVQRAAGWLARRLRNLLLVVRALLADDMSAVIRLLGSTLAGVTE